MNPIPTDEPAPLSAPAASGPEDLLHLARERARHGDYVGARLLTEQAAETPGPHGPEAAYLTALCLEFEGRLDDALAAYDQLMATAPSDDVRFRRAECLGKLGRIPEADDQLSEISGLRALGPADRTKIAVLSGVWELQLGSERKGLRELRQALAIEGQEAGYYRALGHDALLDHALSQADELVFVGSDKAKARALQTRAGLIAVAEEQLAATIRTGEVSFALEGFLRLGRSYEDLGVDLLAETPPRGLTPAQLEIQRELLAERVEKVWVKGTLYFDRGVDLASRENWTTEPVPELQAAWDALVARVDALGVPPGTE